jgi:TPR repeat protein
VNGILRGLLGAAACLAVAITTTSAQTNDGQKSLLSKLSLAEKAEAASVFFKLAREPADKLLAIRLLVEAADLGDVEAAAEVGLFFLKGTDGIPADPKTARKYLDIATSAGNVDALFHLGRALLRGEGLPKDPVAGVKVLSRKLLANSPLAAQAAYEVGQAYLTGADGLKPNPDKARQHLDRAIEGGVEDAKVKLAIALVTGEGLSADAQSGLALLQELRNAGGEHASAATAKLGEIYLTGVAAIPPDPAMARQLLREAAAGGNKDAALRLGRALLGDKIPDGDRLEGVAILSELSVSEGSTGARAGRELGTFFLASAKEDPASAHKARFYLEGAAEKGDESAKFYLGEALLKGAGLPQETARGKELLIGIAGASGPYAPRANFALAVFQLSVPADAVEARTFLEASASAGFKPAQLRLGEELLSGQTFAPEPKAAIKILEQLSSEGGTEADAANLALGTFFLKGGAGIRANPDKARRYLEEAAAARPRIFVNLGRAAFAGELGPADGKKALAYFEKAQAANVSDATSNIARVYLAGAPGVPRNVDKGIELLEQATQSGSSYAARELIAIYRGDRGKGGKPDLEKARSYLEAFKSVGDADEVLFEEALLSIANASGDLGDDTLAFNRISPSQQADAIRRVLSIEPKAAIYIVQDRLKSAGLYTAALDGISGVGTLRAISTACGDGEPGECGSEPLQGRTLAFIVTKYPPAASASN